MNLFGIAKIQFKSVLFDKALDINRQNHQAVNFLYVVAYTAARVDLCMFLRYGITIDISP